jgi:hypothetical protein
LIDFLYDKSEIDEKSNGLKWKSEIEKDFIGYNISLSHGMSSIVYSCVGLLRQGTIAREFKNY